MVNDFPGGGEGERPLSAGRLDLCGRGMSLVCAAWIWGIMDWKQITGRWVRQARSFCVGLLPDLGGLPAALGVV